MTSVSCLVLVDARGTWLATQRPHGKALGGLWEFPGGKVEQGESPEDALRRELREELHVHVGPLEPLTPVTYDYAFGAIELLPFLARCGERPALVLNEHIRARWLDSAAAQALPWAPADLPVLPEVAARLPAPPEATA
ncbi:MAG: (deoxy)nucleoside triphosphate pyrophosphohydrolase [Opitutales bacterium]|nr:(deoxy)nucleoside triphosphate pyrophosphohydrolase [Opitutales bacterium]